MEEKKKEKDSEDEVGEFVFWFGGWRTEDDVKLDDFFKILF